MSHPSRNAFLILGIASVSAFALGRAHAEQPAKPARPLPAESQTVYDQRVLPFLKKYCWECHDEKSAKAGFRVDVLGTDFLAGKTADHWREAVDQINLGKMPKKKTKPDPKDAFAVVEWVNQEIRNAEKRAQSTGGRSPMRRLNRTEYANTVRDLFHLDENFARKLEQELPADGKVDGFDRGGAALFIDKSQFQSYLDAAKMVIDEALPLTAPTVNKQRLNGINDWHILQHPKYPTTTMSEVLRRGDIPLADLLTKEEHEKLPDIPRGPESNDLNYTRDGGLETYQGLPILGYTQTGRMAQKVVTQSGWYRVRIRAGAERGSGKYAVDAVRLQADYCRNSKDYRKGFVFTIDAPLNRPKVFEQKVFLRTGSNLVIDLRFQWNAFPFRGGLHDHQKGTVVPDPELARLYWACRNLSGAYARAVETKQSAEVIENARKKRDEAYANMRQFALTFKGPVNRLNPDIDFRALPRLWYEYIELEGPLTEWPTKAAKEILFKGETQTDPAYVRQIFTRFLPRAYRRPVKPEEIEALVRLVQTMQDKHGKTFGEAVRAAVASVLNSADFLYLSEPAVADAKPHELNDYELANRLSYFLWSTMPDKQLSDLAVRKQLRSPGVLRAQVKRMLVDPRARQFVENFVGQWMKAREFDTVTVDSRQYKDYDDALRDAGFREPYEFIYELLRADLPVLNVLDSDFLVINERLAKLYGIDGVQGEAFRRVPIRPENRRGGILGMAGLMTYLADGTRTLPVRRGAYLLDVLWNTPASLPPPNAGDLPTIKEKNLSVRQRLEQHRSKAFCASCHTKIDPLGLALENYDAIGAWRDRQNGEGRKGGKYDPPIDASGVMPGGQTFQDLAGFKRILVEEKARFLKGFTEKLLAYALGRPVGATDRELVNEVLTAAAKEEFRLQAFLQAITATKAFQTK